MDSHRKFRGNTAENIISEHEGELLRYAALILGVGSLAQDVVETAFIKVLKNQDKISSCPRSQLSAELYRTVHSIAVKLAGKRRTGGTQGSSSANSDAMEAIRQLEPAEQLVIMLRVLEGKNASEIGSIAGMSEERVARLLYKSVMNVKDKFKKAGLL